MPLMTPIHRRMGEFVLANPFRAATMRIDELAQAVNASIATANRFAKALGFDGYPAMRAALVRGFEATLGPVERLRSAQEQESGVRGAAWIDAVFDHTVANIENTRAQLDAADVEAAVEAIVGARRVLILGAGSSAFLTGLMEHGLSVCHDNVQSLALLGGPSHAARRLYTADSRDLVIALAFPRYVKDTIELARRAAAARARVLGISDGPQSPLAPIASLNLYVKAERRFAATSEAAVLAMIEALIDAVALRTHRSAKSAAEMTEFLLPWLVQPQATLPAANPSTHRPKKHGFTRDRCDSRRRRHDPARGDGFRHRTSVPCRTDRHPDGRAAGAGRWRQRARRRHRRGADARGLSAVQRRARRRLYGGGQARTRRGGDGWRDAWRRRDLLRDARAQSGAGRAARDGSQRARAVRRRGRRCIRGRAGPNSRNRITSHRGASRAVGQGARAAAGAMLDHDAATFAFGASPSQQPAEPLDPDRKHGTVGAVACDQHGHIAAATSTGGITNKQPGRVGDSPIIGAGCYADDATCAVSSTGTGEMFIRLATAHDVAAQIAYRGASLAGPRTTS